MSRKRTLKRRNARKDKKAAAKKTNNKNINYLSDWIDAQLTLRTRMLDHIKSSVIPLSIISQSSEGEIFMMEVDLLNKYYNLPIESLLDEASDKDVSRLNDFISLNSGKKLAGYLERDIPLYTFAFSLDELGLQEA